VDPLDELLESLVAEQAERKEQAEEADSGEISAEISADPFAAPWDDTRVEEAADEAAALLTAEVGVSGEVTLAERGLMRRKTRELQRLLAVFLKAGKTLRLYSEDHRFFAGFADEFMTRLNEQFVEKDSVTFEITPVSINWEGHVVFENREQRENLAFKLYRDGVRLLQFRRGVTTAEVRDFVTMIAREVDTGGAGRDLSVLFWEADFKHIHLAIAETFVQYSPEAEAVLREIETNLGKVQHGFELETAPHGVSHYEPEAYGGGSQRGIWDDPFADPGEASGSSGDDETEMPLIPEAALDDERIRAVYEELVGLEDPYATFEEVGSVLAEVVLCESTVEGLETFLGRLDEAVSPLLATASIGPLNSILRRFALIARASLAEDGLTGEMLHRFFLNLCQTERLDLLARALNDDFNEAWKGELFTFVSLQFPESLDELTGFLGRVYRLEARRVMTDALVLLANREAEPFLALLRHNNWRLASDAAYALGRIGDARSLDAMMGAFEREEPSLRREILQSLRPHQSPRIQDLMLDALQDEDEEVRRSALRYLAVYRVRDAVPHLTRTMGAKGFSDRSFDERRGWYITLGHIAGQSAFTAFRKRVEPFRGGEETSEELHLGLLGIRSIRSPEAGQFLETFEKTAKGDLRLLVRKVLTQRKGS